MAPHPRIPLRDDLPADADCAFARLRNLERHAAHGRFQVAAASTGGRSSLLSTESNEMTDNVAAICRPRHLVPDLAGSARRGDRGDAHRVPLRHVPRRPLHDPLHPDDKAQARRHLSHASHTQLRPLPHTQLSIAAPVEDIRYYTLYMSINPSVETLYSIYLTI